MGLGVAAECLSPVLSRFLKTGKNTTGAMCCLNHKAPSQHPLSLPIPSPSPRLGPNIRISPTDTLRTRLCSHLRYFDPCFRLRPSGPAPSPSPPYHRTPRPNDRGTHTSRPASSAVRALHRSLRTSTSYFKDWSDCVEDNVHKRGWHSSIPLAIVATTGIVVTNYSIPLLLDLVLVLGSPPLVLDSIYCSPDPDANHVPAETAFRVEIVECVLDDGQVWDEEVMGVDFVAESLNLEHHG
jgi:hypothetical protein